MYVAEEKLKRLNKETMRLITKYDMWKEMVVRDAIKPFKRSSRLISLRLF